jgi:hypothetical protein
MKTKVDHVTARFGGRDGLVFGIAREDIPMFETMINEPAQARLARISAGHARVNEIAEVIEYAAPKGLGKAIPKAGSADAMTVHMKKMLDAHRPAPKTLVSETFAANPPLKYAVLAQGILAAALYGLPEDAATFNEDEEADDAA